MPAITVPVNIGIDEKSRAEIAEGLSKLLASTYTVYLKTHKFHWNVTGPFFQALHAMFEKQYMEMALAIDTLAERIRSLGFPAAGSYSEFSKLSTVSEEPGFPAAEEMIHALIEDHEEISRIARFVYTRANEVNDQASVELITERMEVHEKFAWMLRSSLGSSLPS
ncbi:MAG: DNA starvation/stationary phase protection protein [Candidatus Omnitrophica bacterium]|nr:DNA starvation/stationary phase protection protein [Candidatus Omnitrophota bacterium]